MVLISKQNRGQMSLEYLVAFLLFTSVLIYLSFQVSDVLPKLEAQSRKDILISKASRVTGSLIKNPGNPTNWNGSGVEADRYGLAVEPYKLSLDKITDFNTSCNGNYSYTNEKLGLNSSDFMLIVYNMSSNSEREIIRCGQRVPEGVSTGSIDRYSCLENGNIVRMVFKIW